MTHIDEAIHALVEARRLGRPAPAPDLADKDAAYAVQDGVARACGWFDGPPRHWKSGGPSRTAMQQHAPLPPAGVWASPADAKDWHFALRGIEAEIAFRLREDVDATRAANLDQDAAAQLIDAMCVSIEIVDSRWREALDAPLLTKLADLQSHGALVLGAWQPYAARNWSQQPCSVSIGAQPAREFLGTHPMQEPTYVLPGWLRHATRAGAVVAAGTVVTTGSWCGIIPAQTGDHVRISYPGIGEASVQL